MVTKNHSSNKTYHWTNF